MDNLDKQIKVKKFFKALYENAITEGNNLKDNQYIRIYQNNNTDNIEPDKLFNKVNFFNNIDELITYSSNKSNMMNTYFQLATTKSSENGQEENLHTRYFLGFDFDKKDLGENFNYKDIIGLFKSIGLWYHAITDSGHGYHVYTCIEPTQDIQKVLEVQTMLCKRLGADKGAIKTTQVLRVPYTYNIKKEIKQVNIIYSFDKETFKRYDIDKLYKRFCCNLKDQVTSDKATEYTTNNTNLQPCIVDILKTGSKDGHKNIDLKKIVVSLRSRNKSLNDILNLCKEWNNKSEKKFSDQELNYQVEYMYKNLRNADYECKGCKYDNGECFNKVVSNFEYPKDINLINLSETNIRYLKANNRKGVKAMKGNELLVYCILKNHNGGLLRSEIEKELTYTKKKVVLNVALGKNTLTKTLSNLENEFIEVTTRSDRNKIYTLKEINSKIELTYNVSYAATYECVKGLITVEELRLYNYMRYLHNKQQREDIKALKGNLFQFNQRDLAKEIGTSQSRISIMINNLLDEKLLGQWYRQPSKNNGYDFIIYRLNY